MLCLAATMAACSNHDTGSAGGWRVSGVHIRLSGTTQTCATAAPDVDTFSPTPTPQPGCTPAGTSRIADGATPAPSPSARTWENVHVEQQYHPDTTQWHPIYSTYTAPPGTGIYQPVVQATNQPMPTPFTTPTPQHTDAPLRTMAPQATQAPELVQPSATP